MEDIHIIAQLINAMEDAYKKLEKAYETKDVVNFGKAKKAILDLQESMAEVAK